LDTTTAVIVAGVVLVVLIVLMFVGFRWLKPERLCLRLKWTGFELEMQRPDEPEPPKRAIKRS
jgi:hypothetical protein